MSGTVAGRSPLTESESSAIRALQRLLDGEDHYAALRIESTSPSTVVDDAYHQFVRDWHPDRFFSRDRGLLGPLIDSNFEKVTHAYRVLRDPARRRDYDAARAAARPQPGVVDTSTSSVFETSFRRSPSRSDASGASSPGLRRSSQPPAVVQKIQEQLSANLEQARRYAAAAVEDTAALRLAQAETNAYLATRFDPTNTEYQEIYKAAVVRNREARASGFVLQGERAEVYAQWTEAAAQYRKAMDLDPASGAAWFRLAKIMARQDDDVRGAVTLVRQALTKEPRNMEYLLWLAETYEGLGMPENARRVVTIAVATDRGHAGAKALLRRVGG